MKEFFWQSLDGVILGIKSAAFAEEIGAFDNLRVGSEWLEGAKKLVGRFVAIGEHGTEIIMPGVGGKDDFGGRNRKDASGKSDGYQAHFFGKQYGNDGEEVGGS